MSDVQYAEPDNLAGVFDALERYGEEARLLAGGTGLVNLMKQRLVQPGALIGLRRIEALRGVSRQDGALRLGAMATHREVETSEVVRAAAPLLAETYRQVATVRIRNVATVGGGLAHADPSQDPPVALVVLRARVVLTSKDGTREIPIEEFFTDYYETAIAPDEVLTQVLVPPQPAQAGAVYLKFLPRTADDYATVAVAALVELAADGETCRDARIALGAVGSTVLQATAAAAALRGQRPTPEALREAAEQVRALVDPVDDYRGSAAYKRDMAVVFTRRALEQALARARDGAR
ncbi:MAG: xanthine dehydrogenase family protein subunit M [Chloroflexi bacterium]|nr:xanthine dehydrogenase family protein subunit M [Chloroflexota bacterium]